MQNGYNCGLEMARVGVRDQEQSGSFYDMLMALALRLQYFPKKGNLDGATTYQRHKRVDGKATSL
jgi:hypothetical protein